MKNNNYSFTKAEFPCLIINLLTVKLFTNIPSVFSAAAGTAATLSALWTSLVTFGTVFMLICLLKCTPHKSFFDFVETVFSKTGRLILAGLFLIYFAMSAVIFINDLTAFVKLISFPTAPMYFVALFIVAAAVVGALSGISGIARLHCFFVPIALAVLLFVLISDFGNANFSNLFPIFGNGCEGIFGKGASGFLMYTDIIILLLITPPDALHDMRKTVLLPSVLGLLSVCTFVFVFTVQIPYPLSTEYKFPLYLLLKEINYGIFFQRIDILLLLAACLCGMLYLSLILSLFTDILAGSFGCSDTRPLIFTAAATLFLSTAGLGLIPDRSSNFIIFCCGLAVIAAALLTIFFAKLRGKSNREKI